MEVVDGPETSSANLADDGMLGFVGGSAATSSAGATRLRFVALPPCGCLAQIATIRMQKKFEICHASPKPLTVSWACRRRCGSRMSYQTR